MKQHIKVLAVLNIVWGSLGAFSGLIVLMIFGALGSIAGMGAPHPHGASFALPLIGGIGGSIAGLVLVMSAPSIIAGIGLLRYRPWAKVLAMIVSALHILNFPLGTALGVYGLWVLCTRKSEECFIAG